MAQDRSYPEVYMAQGSTLQVIGSSGIQEVYGQVDVKSDGHIDVEDGGYIVLPVVTEAASASLDDFGVSVLTATSGLTTYTLGAPGAAGVRKTLIFSGINSTNIAYVYAGAAVTFDTTGTYLRCDETSGFIDLLAMTTAKWMTMHHTTGVTISTGSTA